MYTGIVETTGRVVAVADGDGRPARRVSVHCPGAAASMEPGDSVALSGTCVTAESVDGECITAGLTAETCERTWFDAAEPGDRVNVERPVRVGDRLHGHVVEGTVDATAEVVDATAVPGDDADGGRELRVSLPAGYEDHVVEKSTVAVEGASLTVADRDDDSFAVALVPETAARTTLGDLAAGDRVNVETNVLAKYVRRAEVSA